MSQSPDPAGDFARLDVENIAEELESMGRGNKREIDSRLVVLIGHLLKRQLQVGFRSRSWSATIREQRRWIARLLQESPSLRPFVDQLLTRAYIDARDKAADETDLAETAFSADYPFTADKILAEDCLPGS